MTRKTRAQGLSLNTIVIAIIVLVVLVVLIFIFTGQIGKFGKGIENCPAGPRRCVGSISDCITGEELPVAMNCDPDEGIDYCCVKPGK